MKIAIASFLVALAAGFAAGMAFQRHRASDDPRATADRGPGGEAPAASVRTTTSGSGDAAPSAELAKAKEEVERLKSRLAALSGPPKPSMTPEEAAAKAAELAKRIPDLVAKEDGRALLQLMKELAALGEAGYPGAMEIAEILRKAVDGKDQSWGITKFSFYKAFGGAMVPLMQWALAHPDGASEWFRLHSIDTLTWSPDFDSSTAFLGALASEKSEKIAQELVDNLRGVTDPASIPCVEAAIKAQSANQHVTADLMAVLREMNTPESDREMQLLAGDADPAVREEARLALIAAHPPAAGMWISDIVPEGQAAAAGMKRGDILVSYNGASIASFRQLRDEMYKVPQDSLVTILVHRDGQLVPIQVKGQQKLGIDGDFVSPAK